MDLLVNLYDMGERPLPEGRDHSVVRVLSPDRSRVLALVRDNWPSWEAECAHALGQSPIGCFAAAQGRELLGFACCDATAKGYFGPIGVLPRAAGRGVGRGLLYAALGAMREAGHGYAVIGWADSARGFYEKSLKVFPIPGSQPQNTVYRRLLRW